METPGLVRCVVAVDPGRTKCGLAVVCPDGTAVASRVVSREDAPQEVTDLCRTHVPLCVVVGDGTGSRALVDELRSVVGDYPLEMIDERHSSEEARRLYLHLHPARGLARLVPKPLRSPDAPYDDLVAVVLGRRWWSGRQAE